MAMYGGLTYKNDDFPWWILKMDGLEWTIPINYSVDDFELPPF